MLLLPLLPPLLQTAQMRGQGCPAKLALFGTPLFLIHAALAAATASTKSLLPACTPMRGMRCCTSNCTRGPSTQMSMLLLLLLIRLFFLAAAVGPMLLNLPLALQQVGPQRCAAKALGNFHSQLLGIIQQLGAVCCLLLLLLLRLPPRVLLPTTPGRSSICCIHCRQYVCCVG